MIQNFMGRGRSKYRAKPKHPTKKCGALCCSSRISTSSASSSDEVKSCSPERCGRLSSLTHAMVQARLDEMICNERRVTSVVPRQQPRRERIDGETSGGGGRLILLIALDKSSYDPRSDFRESMREVITSKGMERPKELRTLLNCYMSINSREHRQVILEAFHEVCCSLFSV